MKRNHGQLTHVAARRIEARWQFGFTAGVSGGVEKWGHSGESMKVGLKGYELSYRAGRAEKTIPLNLSGRKGRKLS